MSYWRNKYLLRRTDIEFLAQRLCLTPENTRDKILKDALNRSEQKILDTLAIKYYEFEVANSLHVQAFKDLMKKTIRLDGFSKWLGEKKWVLSSELNNIVAFPQLRYEYLKEEFPKYLNHIKESVDALP